MSIDLPLYNPYPHAITLQRGIHYRAAHVISGLLVYQSGPSEHDPANKIVLCTSDDNEDWSDPTIIVDEAGTHSLNGPCLLEDSSGTLRLTYNRVETDPSIARLGLWFRTSDDGGATWSSATEIETSYSDAAIGGPMVELANGDLLQPFWGGAGGALDACLIRSSDSGEAWGNEVVIGDGSGDSLNYVEPNIIQLDNGDLLCLIRETSGPGIYATTSDDNGATWGAPALAISGGQSAPRMLQLSNNDVVIVYRDDDNGDVTTVRTSDDRGETWGSALVLLEDAHSCTYGGIIELSGSRVGIAYGVKWAVDDGSIHYRVMDFGDLP